MANALSAPPVFPQWTQRVAAEMTGRDPLGLSRVSQNLTDLQMTGIITTTDRARYYSLYCWILWHIGQTEPDGLSRPPELAFQRREAAIALATVLRDPEASPVGKREVVRLLHKAEGKDEIATELQVLPSNKWGGYGQYYGGCLTALELIKAGDGDAIELTDVGIKLAEAAQQVLAPVPYMRKQRYLKSRVPVEELVASADRLSIDAISESFAATERSVLSDLFLATDSVGAMTRAGRRRASLLRILHVVRAYEQAESVITADSLDRQLIYGPCYYGVLWEASDRTVPYAPAKNLEHCTQVWRQFCLHEYLTVAVEGLFCSVLDLITATSNGVAIESISRELLGPGFGRFMESKFHSSALAPFGLLGKLGVPEDLSEDACLKSQRRFTMNHPKSENVLSESEDDNFANVARSVTLLAILYTKWRGMQSDVAYAMVAEKAGGEMCAPNVLPLLDPWRDPAMSWPDALSRLIRRVLIDQHDRVMYGKGRLDSRWIHLEGDRLVQDQSYVAYFRSSRHRQAVNIFVDLGLLRWDDEQGLQVTASGKRILARAA